MTNQLKYKSAKQSRLSPFLFPDITESAAGTHIVCLYDPYESPPLPPTAEAIPLFVFLPDIHRIGVKKISC